jgi:hypothetical protein
LHRGQSTAIQLLGDSTGDGTGAGSTPTDVEWFNLLGDKLGTKFPGHNVVRMLWNDTNSNYDLPTVAQAGPSGESYASFTGVSSGMQFAASPITGDLRIEVKIRLTDYTGAASQVVCAQYTSSGNQVSWNFGLGTNSRPFFAWSTDGTTGAVVSKSATATPTVTDGQWAWFAVEHDVDDGSGNNTVKFYTSPDGITWTQLGSTVTTANATTSGTKFASTGPYTIGSRDSSHALPMAGDLPAGQLRRLASSPSTPTRHSLMPPRRSTRMACTPWGPVVRRGVTTSTTLCS